MTTIPPKIVASMLNRGNYKSLAQASARTMLPRWLKIPGSASDALRACVESGRPRGTRVVLAQKR